MSDFISNILSRHTETGNKVLPRLPGRFEPGGEREKGQSEIPRELNGPVPIKLRDKEPLAENKPGPAKTDRAIAHEKDDPPLQPGHESTRESMAEVNQVFQNNNDSPSFTFSKKNDEITNRSNETDGHPLKTNKISEPDQSSVQERNNPSETIGDKTKGNKQTDVPEPSVSSGESRKKTHVTDRENDSHKEWEFQVDLNKPGGAMGEPPGANGHTQKVPDPASFQFSGESQTGPVIKVSIKQINVRAVTSTAPPVVKQKPRSEDRPVLSLEQYLKERNNKLL